MSTVDKMGSEPPTNMASLLVYCATDSSLMLTVENSTSDNWIPSVKVEASVSWSRTIAKEAQEITGVVKAAVKLLKLTKFWYPCRDGAPVTLYHAVFCLNVDQTTKNKTKNSMGKYRGKVRWVAEIDLTSMLQSNGLKTPELLEWYQLTKDPDLNQFNIVEPCEEVILSKNLSEISDEVLVSGKSTNFFQLVDASGIDKLAQEDLYRNVFVPMSYPAIYMNLRAFTKFVPELGWSKPQVPFLFR